jgi:putative Mg2+ transporter-C (MgtC) family protein
MELATDMPEIADLELIRRLVTAALLGALIGIEREVHQKSAGLRTNILIAVGSALFTLMSIEMAGPGGDPGRIAAQIVTGIGFLGAGAIMRRQGGVHGLTTAATVWVNAAVGVAAGGGSYHLAFIATGITLVSLRILQPVERMLDRRAERKGKTPAAQNTDADRT